MKFFIFKPKISFLILCNSSFRKTIMRILHLLSVTLFSLTNTFKNQIIVSLPNDILQLSITYQLAHSSRIYLYPHICDPVLQSSLIGTNLFNNLTNPHTFRFSADYITESSHFSMEQ